LVFQITQEESMAVTTRIIQAYKQAPWRKQIQWSGTFLLGLVIIVLTAGLYLNISARAATAGLEIQSLEYVKEETNRNMADLRNQLAFLTSEAQMADRAEKLGFRRKHASDPIYLVVPGYTGRKLALLAPPPSLDMITQPIIKPAYTQSLWEWLYKGAYTFNQVQLEKQP
jgi:cell division protein FtsL